MKTKSLAPRVLWLMFALILSPAAWAFDVEKVFNRGTSSLGAAVELTASDTKSADSYTVQSQSAVTARVLSTDAPAASMAGSVTVGKAGNARVEVRLVVEDDTLLNFSRNFDKTTAYKIPSYATSNDLSEETVWVGPIPIKVKGVVNVSTSGAGSVGISPSPSAAPTVGAGLFSVIRASARGSAQSLSDTVRVKFRGKASLSHSSLTTRAKISPVANSDQTTAEYRVDWAQGKAVGDFNVQAKLSLPLGIRKTYAKSLGKFLNSAASGNLAKGSTSLE